MQNNPFLIAAVITCAGLLGACSTAPQRNTLDTITEQLGRAARPGAPAPLDEAVANALLPPVSALAVQLPKARPALEERFNVAFNNVPAQQFFNALVAGTRYNMLVHPDVGGTITANLKDVTLVEALDAVRELYGFDYQIDGTRIAIRPLTMQTRMFHVNYLIGTRKGTSNLRVSSTSLSASASGSQGQNSQPGQPSQNPTGAAGSGQQLDSSNVNSTSSSDFWTELRGAIEAIVGPAKDSGRSVMVSPQSGMVVIRAMPEELRNVDLFLKATQVSVDRQVILEAKILEVELNDSFQSGINWASFGSFGGGAKRLSGGFLTPGTALAPLPAGGGQPAVLTSGALSASAGFSLSSAATASSSLFGLAFQTSNFATLISFLESQGTVHVLSSPRVTAMNNEKAVLKIGTDEFFVTGVTTTTVASATGNTTTPSVTLQPFFSGVVLDVTPQIDDKGNILLHVHPSVSQVSTVVKDINLGSAGNLTLPLAASATSEIDSMVRGHDGQVVAIGGLMRQSSTADTAQLPGVASVPVLGALFRNKNRLNQKRELVVLIKPTIVQGDGNWNEDLLETKNRMQQLDPRGAGPR